MKFIDLFCGIGGIRLGFQQAFGDELKCVFSSEIDKFAIQTYQANFNEPPSGDITKIREQDIPAHDLLLAGFPCQAFSHAGLKRGFDDTRGTLFFDILRIADYHKPKIIFLENVKGLLSHDKGNTFKVITESLESLGYFVSYQVLNARDFGLPQNRNRVFIIATMDKPFDFSLVRPIGNTPLVGDLLETEVDSKFTLSEKLWDYLQARKEYNKSKGNGFGYSLFNSSSSYINTITARYYKDGCEVLIEQEGGLPRKLTPRECARFQGFPDDFVFPVSNTQVYKQLGNSVPVNVIRAIAEAIKLH